MGQIDKFVSFLNKHKVIGLAVAFIIGGAATKLVSAIVNDLIMPIIAVLTPAGDWRKIILEVGPIKFMVGDFAGALIDFIIVAIVVFLLVKYVAHEDGR